MIHILVEQKLTQYCKAIVDNFKKREKKGRGPKLLKLKMKMEKSQETAQKYKGS